MTKSKIAIAVITATTLVLGATIWNSQPDETDSTEKQSAVSKTSTKNNSEKSPIKTSLESISAELTSTKPVAESSLLSADTAQEKIPTNLWQVSEASEAFWQERVTKGHNDKVQSAFIELDGTWLSQLEIGEEFPVKLPFSENEYTAVVTEKKTYRNGAVSLRSKYLELKNGFNIRVTLENGNGFGLFSTPEGMMNLEINSGFARVTAQRSIDNAFGEEIIDINADKNGNTAQESPDTIIELN